MYSTVALKSDRADERSFKGIESTKQKYCTPLPLRMIGALMSFKKPVDELFCNLRSSGRWQNDGVTPAPCDVHFRGCVSKSKRGAAVLLQMLWFFENIFQIPSDWLKFYSNGEVRSCTNQGDYCTLCRGWGRGGGGREGEGRCGSTHTIPPRVGKNTIYHDAEHPSALLLPVIADNDL